MPDFHLFRIKVFSETPLFPLEEAPSDILERKILSNPASQLQKNSFWRIGDVSKFDDNGIYFRLGRLTTSTLERYQDGKFIDEEFETAPYTHVVLDTKYEICAIAKKARLSPKVTGIAKQFQRLMNNSETSDNIGVEFEISPINDPNKLIEYLQRAYNVNKFKIFFSRPNPFDANEDFHKPMSKLLGEANGNKGQTQLEGSSLNSETLAKLSRSVASTGDDAEAILQEEENQPKIKKRLKENPIIISHDDLADENQRIMFMKRIRDRYKKIQG